AHAHGDPWLREDVPHPVRAVPPAREQVQPRSVGPEPDLDLARFARLPPLRRQIAVIERRIFIRKHAAILRPQPHRLRALLPREGHLAAFEPAKWFFGWSHFP